MCFGATRHASCFSTNPSEICPWAFTFGNAFGGVHCGEHDAISAQLLSRRVSLFLIMHFSRRIT